MRSPTAVTVPVVVSPQPTGARDARRLPATSPDRHRVGWLVLASDGPATDLAGHSPAAAVRVVADPRRFRDALLTERPRIVVCAQPPATLADLELVAAERRRRPSLWAVHLAPPEGVTERLAALALGFDDALSTTTPAVELAGRLDLVWTRARPGSSGSVRTVSPTLELDLVAHELRRDGMAVHLRPKEYGLLALLVAHPGRAYSRRQLLERVWGSGHEGGLRTVDVHVRWLRSKIEPDPAHPVHLVTVRGVGYRLDAGQR